MKKKTKRHGQADEDENGEEGERTKKKKKQKGKKKPTSTTCHRRWPRADGNGDAKGDATDEIDHRRRPGSTTLPDSITTGKTRYIPVKLGKHSLTPRAANYASETHRNTRDNPVKPGKTQ